MKPCLVRDSKSLIVY